MKNLFTPFVACLFLFYTAAAVACPTCASSLDDYTPPFFSEEFYTAPVTKKAPEVAAMPEGETNEESISEHFSTTE